MLLQTNAIRKILEEGIETARAILNEYRNELNTLATMLRERPYKEDVKGHEIEELLSGKNMSDSAKEMATAT